MTATSRNGGKGSPNGPPKPGTQRKGSIASTFELEQVNSGNNVEDKEQPRLSVSHPFSVNLEDGDHQSSSSSSSSSSSGDEMSVLRSSSSSKGKKLHEDKQKKNKKSTKKDDDDNSKKKPSEDHQQLETSVRKTTVQNRVNSAVRKQLADMLRQRNAKMLGSSSTNFIGFDMGVEEKKGRNSKKRPSLVAMNKKGNNTTTTGKGGEVNSILFDSRPPRASVANEGEDYDDYVDIFLTKDEEDDMKTSSSMSDGGGSKSSNPRQFRDADDRNRRQSSSSSSAASRPLPPTPPPSSSAVGGTSSAGGTTSGQEQQSDTTKYPSKPQARMTSFMLSVSRILNAYQKKTLQNNDVKSKTKHEKRKQRQSIRSGDLIHFLPRGGVSIITSLGPVQFGIPPETVKDSMELGIRVPSIYVVPRERFNLQRGVNVCEIEFPAFFNYFVLMKRTTLVTHKDCYEDLIAIMNEALNGPAPEYLYAEKEYSDFCPESVRAACPDHAAEIFHFRAPNRTPGKTPKLLDVDMLLDFKFFDENGVCDLGEGVFVYDDEENARFELRDDHMQKGRARVQSFGSDDDIIDDTIMIAYSNAESCRGPESLAPKAIGGDDENYKQDGVATSEDDDDDDDDNDDDVVDDDGSVEHRHLSMSEQTIPGNHGSNGSNKKEYRASAMSVTSTSSNTTGGGKPKRKSLIKFSSFRPSSNTTGNNKKKNSKKNKKKTKKDKSASKVMNGGTFAIPKFGLTVLGNSHGFDPRGSTSGFVLWVNGQGVMVDPPPHSTDLLNEAGIHSSSITALILTHCHADHDAGTFQKMITEHKITLMTTTTIFESFKRKYAAVSGLKPEFIQQLVNFRPMFLEEPNYWNGACFRFFYSLHSIPCVGFQVNFQEKSIVYSGDTFYDPPALKKIHDDGILSDARLQALLDFPWHCDIVLHEAGVPPIHTPIEALADLPKHCKKNIYLIHIDRRAAARAETYGFRIAQAGVENTIVLIPHGEEQEMLKFLQLISSMEIFAHFEVSQALDLMLMCREVSYPKDSVILRKGVIYDRFMIILQGNASVGDEKDDTKKVFRAGDYLGELAAWNQSRISKRGENEEDQLVKETIHASTDVKVMEIDKYALNYLLMVDPILRERLEVMIHARVDGSWEAISSNTHLRLLTSSQKTQLQALLTQRQLVRGDVVWSAGEKVSVAVLISKGSFIFEEIHGKLEGDEPERMEMMTHAPLSTGMLLFDYYGVHGNRPLTTTLVCQSHEATIFLLRSEKMLRFLDRSPRILLSLLKSAILV